MTMKVADIDYDKLEAIRWQHFEIRNTQGFTDLSSIYVPGEGDNPTTAFLVGEAPGADEEIGRAHV